MATAAEILKTVGLRPDGPVRWGAPVRSGKPGIFVVEIGEPVTHAPVDPSICGKWIERVTTLLLDGEQPDGRQLAKRLAAFWIPSQTVLYVDSAGRSLGARVGALYATELGSRRPHSGGHWLKTLRGLDQARVWWAETDAAEEPAPTAIARSVRPPARPAGPARRAGPRRTPAAAQAGAPGAERSPASAIAAQDRPAPEPTYVSVTGVERLEAELADLRDVQRPAVVVRIKTARELGDLRENADYDAARREQSFIEGRVQAIEAILRTAHVVDEATTHEVIIGSVVTLEREGDTIEYTIVGSSEANPTQGRVSYLSPLGKALLGRRAGDEVVVRAPSGERHYRITGVR